MNIFFLRSRCPIVRDLIMARATEPDAKELPGFAENHLIACRSCREFSQALPVIDRLRSEWRTSEPPPGLAIATITRLEAHWPQPERPVSRQERRLIWTTGLSLAGAFAAVFLILADRIYPVANNTGLEHVVEIGLKIGFVQILGGAVISIILLAVKASRTPESDIRDRDDQHGAGRE